LKKVISIVGARPNFMKIGPFHKALRQSSLDVKHLICHTGQHYDQNMSKIFFDDFELPSPDFYLGVGSGSHAEQVAKIMMSFEKIVENEKPDLIIVVGDVNSTMAGSLVAAKMGIKVAHIEAGLRSFDRTMPEEINRIVTDSIADYLFVTERSGLVNLKNEGVSSNKIFFVGNIMIDSLVHYLSKASSSLILDRLNLKKQSYLLVTLHRPSNVDDKENLKATAHLLKNLAKSIKIVFPIHPRTKENLEKYGLDATLNHEIEFTEPLGYIDFLCLQKNAEVILTDSGGIQEESTYLGVQCVTMRDNTERPVTVEMGTNHLAGKDVNNVQAKILAVLSGQKKAGKIPELWDGKAANRIVNYLSDLL